MTKFFANFLRDESGAAAAEYVILVGLIGAAVAGGAFAFGTQLKTAMGNSANRVTSCVASTTGTC